MLKVGSSFHGFSRPRPQVCQTREENQARLPLVGWRATLRLCIWRRPSACMEWAFPYQDATYTLGDMVLHNRKTSRTDACSDGAGSGFDRVTRARCGGLRVCSTIPAIGRFGKWLGALYCCCGVRPYFCRIGPGVRCSEGVFDGGVLHQHCASFRSSV